MASRRWVTCQGCGVPLPRPRRGAATELRCPWCETGNPLNQVKSTSIPGFAAIPAVIGAAVALAAVGHVYRATREDRVRVLESSSATASLDPIPVTRGDRRSSGHDPARNDAPAENRAATLPELNLTLNRLPSPPPPWLHDERPTLPALSIDRVDRDATVPVIQPIRVGDLPRPPSAGRPHNVLVGDSQGHRIVARYEADSNGGAIVTMPDGQLGRAEMLFPTDAPFVPLSSQRLAERLTDGPFAGFQAITTRHYIVLSSGSEQFAKATSRLLESLYQGLADLLRRQGLPIHEAEFPLVAVIDATEDEFRARKSVADEVRAYYDPLTNRIALFETSVRDADAPELSAMNQPRIIAHEGTHQVLQNIGVQPRLSPWPAWLREGLAEYCAPTATNPDGTWKGCGTINPLHMATLRDLDDPLARMIPKRRFPSTRPSPNPRQTPLETLLTRSELAPIDYAVAWSLTYYLAQKRPREFREYLARMARSRPLDNPSPQDQLNDFRAAFGANVDRLDQKVRYHLSSRRGYPELPYYCVYFEQSQADGSTTQDAIASQSPAVIEQWLKDHDNPEATAPAYREILPAPTKMAAALILRSWGFDSEN